MKLIEIYKLNEKLVNASHDKKFFWAAGGHELTKGDSVPSFDGVYDEDEVEAKFEEVRKKMFSDKPSRIGNIFVFPNVYSAVRWRRESESDTFAGNIYQVDVTGKVFFTDMKYFTEVTMTYGDGDNQEKILSQIKKYWNGVEDVGTKRSSSNTIEAIVDGEVKIVRQIDNDKVKKLYSRGGI